MLSKLPMRSCSTVAVYLLGFTVIAMAQCDKEKAQQQQKCPSEIQPALDAAANAAKSFARESINALNVNNKDTQTWFEWWMGHACNPKRVIAVLEGIVNFDYGIYCDPSIAGGATSSYCSIVVSGGTMKDLQKETAPPSQSMCAKGLSTLSNTLVHEMAHAQKYTFENGSQHWVNDGNHMPYKSSDGRTCYNPSCLRPNAQYNDECYNGFNANAYAYLTWAIHCQNGTFIGDKPFAAPTSVAGSSQGQAGTQEAWPSEGGAGTQNVAPVQVQ